MDADNDSSQAVSDRRREYERMLNAVKELGHFIFPEERPRDQTGMRATVSTSATLMAPKEVKPQGIIPIASLSPFTEAEPKLDSENAVFEVPHASTEARYLHTSLEESQPIPCDSDKRASPSTESEIARLSTELSQRNQLIQYLARQLRDFCQANDRLFADYEAQEANLTSQLRTLRTRLIEATETLRRSSMKSWREPSDPCHLVSSTEVQNAPLAVALLEFAGELQIRLISYNRNLVGDDTRIMANAAANLLTSRTTVHPCEWTELSRHLFQSILSFMESTLRKESAQQNTDLDELENRANQAEAEVYRLNTLVNELRQELQALNATLSQPSMPTKEHEKIRHRVEESSTSDDTVALCLSSTGSPGPWPHDSVVLQHTNVKQSPQLSGLSPSSSQAESVLPQQPQQHEAHVYLHTPTSPDLVPVVLGDQQLQFDMTNLLERLQRLLTTKQNELNQLETLNSRAQMEKFVWKQTEIDVLNDTCRYLLSQQELKRHPRVTPFSSTAQIYSEPTDRSGLYQSQDSSPNKWDVERSRSIPRSIGVEQRGRGLLAAVKVEKNDPVPFEQRLRRLLCRMQFANRVTDGLQTYMQSDSISVSVITLDEVMNRLELEMEALSTLVRHLTSSKTESVQSDLHLSGKDGRQNAANSVRIQLFESDQPQAHDEHRPHFVGEKLTEYAPTKSRVIAAALQQIRQNLTHIRSVQNDLAILVHDFTRSAGKRINELKTVIQTVPSRIQFTESSSRANRRSTSIQTLDILTDENLPISAILGARAQVGVQTKGMLVVDSSFSVEVMDDGAMVTANSTGSQLQNGTTELIKLVGSVGLRSELESLRGELNAANNEISGLTSCLAEIHQQLKEAIPPDEKSMVADLWSELEFCAVPQFVQWYIRWCQTTMGNYMTQIDRGNNAYNQLVHELNAARDHLRSVEESCRCAESNRLELEQEVGRLRRHLNRQKDLYRVTGARDSVEAELEAQTVALLSTETPSRRQEVVEAFQAGESQSRHEYSALVAQLQTELIMEKESRSEITFRLQQALDAARHELETSQTYVQQLTSEKSLQNQQVIELETRVNQLQRQLAAKSSVEERMMEAEKPLHFQAPTCVMADELQATRERLICTEQYLSSVQQQLKEVSETKSCLESRVLELEKDAKTLQAIKIDAQQRDLARANTEEQFRLLQQTAQQLERELSTLRWETEESKGQVQLLTQNKADLTQQLACEIKKYAQAETELTRLRQVNEQLTTQMNNACSNLSKTLQQMTELSARSEGLASQKSHLESELSLLADQLAQQTHSHETLRTEFDAMQQSYRIGRFELEQRCNELTAQVEVLRTVNSELEQKLSMKNTVAVDNSATNMASVVGRHVQMQLEETDKTNAKVCGCVAELEKNAELLEHAKEDLRLSELARVNAENKLREMQQKTLTLQTELCSVRASMEQTKKEVENFNQIRSELAQKLSIEEQRVQQKELEISQLRETTESLNRDLERTSSELRCSLGKVSELSNRSETLESGKTRLEMELKSISEQLVEEKRNCSLVRTELSLVQKSYQSTRNELERQCAELSAKIEQLELMNHKLTREFSLEKTEIPVPCIAHADSCPHIAELDALSSRNQTLLAENSFLSKQLNEALGRCALVLENLRHRDINVQELNDLIASLHETAQISLRHWTSTEIQTEIIHTEVAQPSLIAMTEENRTKSISGSGAEPGGAIMGTHDGTFSKGSFTVLKSHKLAMMDSTVQTHDASAILVTDQRDYVDSTSCCNCSTWQIDREVMQEAMNSLKETCNQQEKRMAMLDSELCSSKQNLSQVKEELMVEKERYAKTQEKINMLAKRCSEVEEPFTDRLMSSVTEATNAIECRLNAVLAERDQAVNKLKQLRAESGSKSTLSPIDSSSDKVITEIESSATCEVQRSDDMRREDQDKSSESVQVTDSSIELFSDRPQLEHNTSSPQTQVGHLHFTFEESCVTSATTDVVLASDVSSAVTTHIDMEPQAVSPIYSGTPRAAITPRISPSAQLAELSAQCTALSLMLSQRESELRDLKYLVAARGFELDELRSGLRPESESSCISLRTDWPRELDGSSTNVTTRYSVSTAVRPSYLTISTQTEYVIPSVMDVEVLLAERDEAREMIKKLRCDLEKSSSDCIVLSERLEQYESVGSALRVNTLRVNEPSFRVPKQRLQTGVTVESTGYFDGSLQSSCGPQPSVMTVDSNICSSNFEVYYTPLRSRLVDLAHAITLQRSALLRILDTLMAHDDVTLSMTRSEESKEWQLDDYWQSETSFGLVETMHRVLDSLNLQANQLVKITDRLGTSCFKRCYQLTEASADAERRLSEMTEQRDVLRRQFDAIMEPPQRHPQYVTTIDRKLPTVIDAAVFVDSSQFASEVIRTLVDATTMCESSSPTEQEQVRGDLPSVVPESSDLIQLAPKPPKHISDQWLLEEVRLKNMIGELQTNINAMQRQLTEQIYQKKAAEEHSAAVRDELDCVKENLNAKLEECAQLTALCNALRCQLEKKCDEYDHIQSQFDSFRGANASGIYHSEDKVVQSEMTNGKPESNAFPVQVTETGDYMGSIGEMDEKTSWTYDFRPSIYSQVFGMKTLDTLSISSVAPKTSFESALFDSHYSKPLQQPLSSASPQIESCEVNQSTSTKLRGVESVDEPISVAIGVDKYETVIVKGMDIVPPRPPRDLQQITQQEAMLKSEIIQHSLSVTSEQNDESSESTVEKKDKKTDRTLTRREDSQQISMQLTAELDQRFGENKILKTRTDQPKTHSAQLQEQINVLAKRCSELEETFTDRLMSSVTEATNAIECRLNAVLAERDQAVNKLKQLRAESGSKSTLSPIDSSSDKVITEIESSATCEVQRSDDMRREDQDKSSESVQVTDSSIE
ncbi:hypothetical protein FGIG_00831 [Fasciola gigantica]|uniref:Uncharacterized protein n=1 Tax=Fasciola gigantica TaxID=46835 RepID=A0A504YTG6_FASGI|nr:hypothetical protein FGIG_00831 [Fasciola gigantica]